MCVFLYACLCVSHVTFRNMCCYPFFSFLSPPPPYSSFYSLTCPEAQQLVTLPLLFPHTAKGGVVHPTRGEPEWSSHRTIPEISLNLHLRFHLPHGDWGIEGGIYAFGWGEGEEKQRKTAVVRIPDFSCRTAGRAGRVLTLLLAKQCVCVRVCVSL